MIEREKLICMLVGWYTGKNPNISAIDLRISIDQHLIECNQQPLDKNDNELLDNLIAETIIKVLGSGINRKTRRAYN